MINVQMQQLSGEEFQRIRQMVYSAIGVNLSEAKRPLVISRLSGRLRKLDLKSFGEYLHYLELNPGELEIMFNSITTNVTKFFREADHFDFLVQHYLPFMELMAGKGKIPKKIRIWSAGCSTGEEPYTLGMVLLEYFKGKEDWDLKILASDINTEILQKAQSGIYSRQEVAGIPYSFLTKYFRLGTGSNQGLFKVKEALRDMVEFRRINLTAANDYPLAGPLNIIFCRNVFIYFDNRTRNSVLRRYHRWLLKEGLLFVGHSESVDTISGENGSWRQVKHAIYERKELHS